MKFGNAFKIGVVCFVFVLALYDGTGAQIPEHDITVGRTIHTDKPVCLVYRDDGFWVTQAITEDTLRHYSMDGTLLAEYQLPGSVQRYGVAWDGAHWWIGDNNYGSETIYKCELNESEKRLEPVRAYAWPYLGPSGLEWAQGYLWVSDDATDIIYRVSVGDTSFTAIEDWCSTNPEPWDLAWDGTNIWSITGPGGGFDPVHGEREIYKHDAAGNIIEIWHYPPADDPGQGSYGGFGTGLAFAGSQLWYCDTDRNEIIEGILEPAENWQIVYQTDFSSDPGWITSWPDRYVWDPATGTYCFSHIMYTYSYVPIAYDPTLKYKLEFDINLTQCEWGSYFNLGLWDADMLTKGPTHWHVRYHHVDEGNSACIVYWTNDLSGGGDSPIMPFALNTWYHNKAIYDPTSDMFTLEITRKDDGVLLGTYTLAAVGEFLNIERLGISCTQSTYGDRLQAGCIDNVVLSVPAVGPVIPPIAEAGDDIVADANEVVTLDGSGSSDPDGQIIKYTWKRLPDGVIIYSGSDPTCQTRALGRVEEVIELTVTDNSMATATDTLKIISRTTQDLKDQLAALQSQIEQLQQQNQRQQDLIDRICAWPPIKQWLRRAIRLGDLNQDGKVNMSDFALLTKDWLR